ncbi:unnamed protein product [Urochloa decumbens]|uniref:Uncharacterized protein n=1 Tax=Urochloa decumbens TaxID=240449 RepID=A0ABC8V9X9_9POAL
MASSASALNSVAVACLLALIVIAAGAARTEPDAKAETTVRLLCHSHNGWSDQLCRDVCQANGFSGYDFALASAATGNLARCCCCPKGKICIQVE